MPRKPRYYLPDIPCHVIQRGNNRQASFYTDDDYTPARMVELTLNPDCLCHGEDRFEQVLELAQARVAETTARQLLAMVEADAEDGSDTDDGADEGQKDERPDDHEENEFDAVIDEDDDDGPDDAEESETEENKGQEELTE